MFYCVVWSRMSYTATELENLAKEKWWNVFTELNRWQNSQNISDEETDISNDNDDDIEDPHDTDILEYEELDTDEGEREDNSDPDILSYFLNKSNLYLEDLKLESSSYRF